MKEKEYMRLESDSIGTMEVPEDAYYGVQALRAKENFPITGTRLHPVFIKNLAKIKRAAAITNRKAGRLKPEIANAIESACKRSGLWHVRQRFHCRWHSGRCGNQRQHEHERSHCQPRHRNALWQKRRLYDCSSKRPHQYGTVHKRCHSNRW